MLRLVKGFGLSLLMMTCLGVVSMNSHAAGRSIQEIAGSMLKDIHKTTWIEEGKGPHVLYIFYDPNCPYCHKLYLNTRSWVKAGKLKIRWVTVGILTTTSAGKAAAILGAKDPAKAFHHNEDNYSRGGAIEEDIPTPEIETKLKANERILARTGFGGVPVMLFRAKDNTPYIVQGAPPESKLKLIFTSLK